MRFRTKNTKNYLSNLPNKTQFNYKILDKTDELLKEIKSAEIPVEDLKLLDFYKKFIAFIETHFITIDGKFELQRYAELRNNIVDIDEEFIKEYGNDIINYIKNDEESLVQDIEKLETKFDFKVRDKKVKKQIKENNKIKDIYIREKRDIKEYDFTLYINEIFSSIQHIISKEINDRFNKITTREEFFHLYFENQKEICEEIFNNIDLIYGFLKDIDIKIFKDVYSFVIDNLDEIIIRILRTTAQFSRFYQLDVYDEYAHERNSKQAIKKVKKEIRYRNK